METSKIAEQLRKEQLDKYTIIVFKQEDEWCANYLELKNEVCGKADNPYTAINILRKKALRAAEVILPTIGQVMSERRSQLRNEDQ